jgi:hypothetical protein
MEDIKARKGIENLYTYGLLAYWTEQAEGRTM